MKLRKLSLFGAMAGALMLTAALAPKANATFVPIVYFNFESGTQTSVPAPGPGGLYTHLQTVTIANDTTKPFPGAPGGHFGVVAGEGTTTNELTGDTPSSNSALDLNGNSKVMGGQSFFCFDIGGSNLTPSNGPNINTTGDVSVSLSFALQSLGNGGQFNAMEVSYSTNGGTSFTATPEGLVSINQDGAYHTYTFNLNGAANSANVAIQICMTGSVNSANANHTNIDNIVVTADVPEPSTYIGGLLGIGVLCWSQRRRLIGSFRLRRA